MATVNSTSSGSGVWETNLDRKVRAYTQTINDVYNDTRQKARAIGTLTDNESSLIVKGTLGKTKTNNNVCDYYSFKVGKTASDIGLVFKAQGKGDRITVKTTTYSSVDVENDVGYARIQLLDKRGTVIADSSTTATKDQKEAYQDWRNAELELNKGNYYVKVSYGEGVMRNKSSQYAFQLLAGTMKKAYSTTQYLAKTAETSKPNLAATALSILSYSDDTAVTYGSSTGTILDYSS